MLKWNAKVVVREDWGASEAACVLTKDGRYRRCKITSKLKEGGTPKWGACYFKKFKKNDKGSWLPCETLGDGSPKYYKDEDEATQACESHAVARQAKKDGKVEEAKVEEKTPSKPAKATVKTKTKVAKVEVEKTEIKEAKSKPGVIQVIITLLRGASEDSPITKPEILKALVVSFPDRDEAKMKATLSMQVPSGLRIEKDLTVKKSDKGYWLPKDQMSRQEKKAGN